MSLDTLAKLTTIRAKDAAADRLAAAVDLALTAPAHLKGCLWLKNHRDVCQCGSHDRVNAAMREVRAALDAYKPLMNKEPHG